MFRSILGSSRLPAAIMIAAVVAPASVHASCGGAFCPVNTQWNIQGVWTEPGWRADLRYEFVSQSQLRAGSNTVNVGEIPQDHDELKTINRNVLATLDYGFGNGIGVTALVPVTDRTHKQIDVDDQELESWDFTEVGDVQMLGRYQFPSFHTPYIFGLYIGAKLPTGQFNIRNSDGDQAERSLQPGTGTTDALVGFYFRQNIPSLQSSWFTQTIFQRPLNSRDDYRPGERVSVDVGYRYEMTRRLSLLLQFNGQYKWRDSGLAAEPQDSGSRTISLSPGISYGLTDAVQVYGFMQQPVYQYVNGVQLTSDWSVITGVSLHF